MNHASDIGVRVTPCRPPQDRVKIGAGGFTLVEMLVSVALVLLMMTLFAQIFQIAGGSVSTQRGIMENDQRARTAQILLYNDLKYRTFRTVCPFTFNESEFSNDDPAYDLSLRQGYFYVSENETANDTDDVLGLTATIPLRDLPQVGPFYGRALGMWPHPAIPTGPTPPQVSTSVPLTYRDDLFFRYNPNQPETDDSRQDYNQSGSSQTAEIVYFLRNGNLYRRVLLVRTPSDGTISPDDQQPQDISSPPNQFFDRIYPLTGGRFPGDFSQGYSSSGVSLGSAVNFWRHFDYSAHPKTTVIGGAYVYNGLEFNSLASLTLQLPFDSFAYSSSTTSFQIPDPLAYPPNRFGFNTVNAQPLVTGPEPPFGGQPKEYGASGLWVGRPTMEETSHAGMQYPMLVHNAPASTTDAANDFNPLTAWTDANKDGVIDEYAGGPWRGEDLLLTNVHAFDIKVWDEQLGEFADVGHGKTVLVSGNPIPVGDFNLSNRKNSFFGANSATNRVFDTWYPFHTEDIDYDFVADTAEVDTNMNGVVDSSEDADQDGVLDDLDENLTNTASFDGQLLNFDASTVTPTVSLADSNGDGMVDIGENLPPFRPLTATPKKPVLTPDQPNTRGDYRPYERWVASNNKSVNSRYQVGDRVFPSIRPHKSQFGDPFYYVCTRTQEVDGNVAATAHGTSDPDWARRSGKETYDGDLVWQAVDNRKPLRAIQITLRFVDPTTGQMRTLTLQHSLVD
jgi:type II secretory pathway pseudopilin PulG